MRALKNALTTFSGATVTVDEGGTGKDCNNVRSPEDQSTAAAVPDTPEENIEASGLRKRSGSEQEADVERNVKKRVNLEPDSDEDVIVLSQPGTGALEQADYQPDSANTAEHDAVSLMRAASAWHFVSSTTNNL